MACDVWRAACGVWRVACGVWRAACGVLRAACGVRHYLVHSGWIHIADCKTRIAKRCVSMPCKHVCNYINESVLTYTIRWEFGRLYQQKRVDVNE